MPGLIKLGNPAGCPCCAPPCKTDPQFCCSAGGDCCALPADTIFTLTHAGATFAVITVPPGSGVHCVPLTGLPAGDALSWTATCGALPERSGTAVVPRCGGIAAGTAYWTLADLLPDTLHASVNGPESIIGGGGAWSGPLVRSGPGVAITSGGFSGWTEYTWDGGCFFSGAFGWTREPAVCYAVTTHGDCGDPYGGVSGTDFPAGSVRTRYLEHADYGSTRALLRIRTPPAGSPPGTSCSILFSWRNYWAGGCPDAEQTDGAAVPPGTDPFDYCDTYSCPCGVDDFPPHSPAAPFPMPDDWILPKTVFPSWTVSPGQVFNFGSAAVCSPPDWSGSASWGTSCGASTCTITA